MSRRHKKRRGETTLGFKIFEIVLSCAALVAAYEGAQNREELEGKLGEWGNNGKALASEAWKGTVDFVHKEAPAVGSWLDGVNRNTCFDFGLTKDGGKFGARISVGCDGAGSRK